jgi:hypothetical protein
MTAPPHPCKVPIHCDRFIPETRRDAVRGINRDPINRVPTEMGVFPVKMRKDEWDAINRYVAAWMLREYRRLLASAPQEYRSCAIALPV